MAGINYIAECPICLDRVEFSCPDDYYSCRDDLRPLLCPHGDCVTRERAVAEVLFSILPRSLMHEKVIYECSPCMRGISHWLKSTCPYYTPTGYFPDEDFGKLINGIRNENLEQLTLDSDSVDIWLHLDVLEHLYSPFNALQEIYRTLRTGGVCIFTAPTYPERIKSQQVAFKNETGSLEIIGEPEFHGNPQRPQDGALVTWRYGYDLPLLIQRETGFDVEVRRWQSKKISAMGIMTEVYICSK